MLIALVEMLFSENEVSSKIKKILADNMFFRKKMALLLMHVKMEDVPCWVSTEKHSAPRWYQNRNISLKQKDFILHFHLPLEQIFSYVLNKSSLISSA